TDDHLNFEDLILFAINYGTVAAPHGGPASVSTNQLVLHVPELPAIGETFTATLELAGAGNIQALSAHLGYDAAVVEPISVEGGALLADQALPATVLSSEPGDVDVALLGSGAGLEGHGEIARVTFRVKAAGAAAIRLAETLARDAENH